MNGRTQSSRRGRSRAQSREFPNRPQSFHYQDSSAAHSRPSFDSSTHGNRQRGRSRWQSECTRSVSAKPRCAPIRSPMPASTSPDPNRPKYSFRGSPFFYDGYHYHYRPMSDPKHQTRLLKIQNRRDGLRGKLHIFDDDDLPSYRALSYTWGDSRSDTYRIFLCNDGNRGRDRSTGGYLYITKSLHELLSHVAPRSGCSRWLWTDAICIQQEGDPEEKTHQLRKMKDIYENAYEVFAWLGSGTPESDSGMRAIKGQVSDELEEQRKEPRLRGSIGRLSADSRGSYKSMRSNSTFKQDDFSSWLYENSSGVEDVFRRQYWTRMWILQELAVSKDSATIACGRHRIPWFRFVNIAMRIASCEESCKRYGLQHHVWLLAQIYQYDSRQLYMSKAIHLTQNAMCRNVTDTVHAILGLVKMGNGTKLRLHSDDSPQTVLYRTIRCMAYDLEALAHKNRPVWGRKLERWQRQVVRIREKRQFGRSPFRKFIAEKEAIWEECENSMSGLNLCHQLARICHESEVLYGYCSPDGVRFDCTLTRVTRVRRERVRTYHRSYNAGYGYKVENSTTSRRYVY